MYHKPQPLSTLFSAMPKNEKPPVSQGKTGAKMYGAPYLLSDAPYFTDPNGSGTVCWLALFQ